MRGSTREHEDYGRFIEAERRGIADLSDGVGEERWDIPSPCAGWRVRDVAARTAADQVWAIGFPFLASERMRGLRLTAEDTDWAVGEGTEVRGPLQALLMTLTGRAVCLAVSTGRAARGDGGR
ncbi:maleylpyruvate isomerase N-terminal domain-containing protein [Nocardiopsis sp. FIRDI 009]|uniref:maleylpyruvate isomerase N-terminal domain-containing protein n=1 Tax=Nocardiopsis sp. FIRDI 009 TaxID=714197 RepID=UPI000E25BFB2|nr:maleylpyruvate isomerase N-terminal domain-containing protein [Nocardiopsis sp. FIRDI 009]